MNTKDQGDLGEILVTAQALKKGLTVCSPVGDNRRYDLLFDDNNNFSKVQVKCITPKNGKLTVSLFTVMHDKEQNGNRYRRSLYTKDQVDLLAVVNSETYEIYMIPFSEIDGQGEVHLRLDDALVENKNIRYAKKYIW